MPSQVKESVDPASREMHLDGIGCQIVVALKHNVEKSLVHGFELVHSVAQRKGASVEAIPAGSVQILDVDRGLTVSKSIDEYYHILAAGREDTSGSVHETVR